MTSLFHVDVRRDKTLYKFVWVQSGSLDLEVDHVLMLLQSYEIISLTPLHQFTIIEVRGEYPTSLFNSNRC